MHTFFIASLRIGTLEKPEFTICQRALEHHEIKNQQINISYLFASDRTDRFHRDGKEEKVSQSPPKKVESDRTPSNVAQ